MKITTAAVKINLLFPALILLLLMCIPQASAQTYMRRQGLAGEHSALSLEQVFQNLAVQQRSSNLIYGVGAANFGPNGMAFAGGAGFRIAREEGPQLSLEYLQGETFLRAQGSGELFSFDLNVPIIGSPYFQTLAQALAHNLAQGVRNLTCDDMERRSPGYSDRYCRDDDGFSVAMEAANNRQTTGFGLRLVVLAAEGQYLHQLATSSPSGSYVVLTPSILVNLLHVDYRTLRDSGLSSVALRVGGFPVAFGAGVSGDATGLGAGGTVRVDVELVYHLGHGHFIGFEALYRFFGAYHEAGGTSLSAIHDLRGAVGYSYWSSHRRGTGIGVYARPTYQLNIVDVSSDAHPNGQATVNQTPALNLGVEF